MRRVTSFRSLVVVVVVVLETTAWSLSCHTKLGWVVVAYLVDVESVFEAVCWWCNNWIVCKFVPVVYYSIFKEIESLCRWCSYFFLKLRSMSTSCLLCGLSCGPINLIDTCLDLVLLDHISFLPSSLHVGKF